MYYPLGAVVHFPRITITLTETATGENFVSDSGWDDLRVPEGLKGLTLYLS